MSNHNHEFPELTTKKDDSLTCLRKYTEKARELFGDALVIEEENEDKHHSPIKTTTLSTDAGKVHIWYDDLTIGFDIEGADTPYWHNGEVEGVDEYFWAAMGVLRNGIVYVKPLLGFEQAWMYCDEADIWVVTPKKYHAYGYTKFTTRAPRKIKA